MEKFIVKVEGYKNLTARFRTKSAAALYCEKLWEELGIHIYLKSEILQIL